MRLFSSKDTLFPHPWAVVTAASWQKYPNPEWSPHITTVDYLDRHVDEQGRLVTTRLLSCQQSLPESIARFFGVGSSPASLVVERSIVDPRLREMMLETRNLSYAHLMVVEERCQYTPVSPSLTRFSQECRIRSVHGWSWLSRHIEDFCVSRFQANASRGKRALEEAILKIEQTIDALEDSFEKVWCDDSHVGSK